MRITLRRALLTSVVLIATAPWSLAGAQDLGFLSTVFARVHRLSMFVHSVYPTGDEIINRDGKGCLTLALCGAGTRVLIDLDTRSDRLEVSLGFGASYLRTLRARTSDSLDIRSAIRSLPVLSTQATYMSLGWIRPYIVGSFGLVDLWNARAHNAAGKQAEIKASAFEYGMSLGVGVAPPHTNGRLLLEAGYRARNFGSVGYTFAEPLGRQWPRELDLSGWQASAGWQFDLRPITKAPGVAGSWVLTRVDGVLPPVVLRQERQGAGPESARQEIVNAYLELETRGQQYSLQLVTRTVTLSANGVAQALRFDEPMRESGTWERAQRTGLRLTPAAPAGAGPSSARVADDELVVEHQLTGRRLHFRKVKTSS